MSLSPSSRDQLAREAVSLSRRAAPDREVHLTPHAWLVLSGEPVAELAVWCLGHSTQVAVH